MAAFAAAVPVTGYPSVLFPVIEAVGALTTGAATVAVAGSLADSPSASATAVTVSPSTNSGTSVVQLPSPSAVVVIGAPPLIANVMAAPGSAVPLIVVSPAVNGLIVGVSV